MDRPIKISLRDGSCECQRPTEAYLQHEGPYEEIHGAEGRAGVISPGRSVGDSQVDRMAACQSVSVAESYRTRVALMTHNERCRMKVVRCSRTRSAGRAACRTSRCDAEMPERAAGETPNRCVRDAPGRGNGCLLEPNRCRDVPRESCPEDRRRDVRMKASQRCQTGDAGRIARRTFDAAPGPSRPAARELPSQGVGDRLGLGKTAVSQGMIAAGTLARGSPT